MNKRQLIEKLALAPHVEGGYFARTYRSDLKADMPCGAQPRYLLSSIFYLLTDDSAIGYLHRNNSDIIHYFHGGAPLSYWIIHPDGKLEKTVLGANLDQGQQLQLLVRGGCWKATELESGEFGLISEAVAPAFEYEDMQLAQEGFIKEQFPHLWPQIAKYVQRKT